MAGEIGWKSVELQIEALIPGVLILAEARALAISWSSYRVTTTTFMPVSEFPRAALFVAAAYSAGVVSSLVSRLIIDSISERGPRKLVFGLFAHSALDQAIRDCEINDSRFIDDYQNEKKKRKWSKSAWWNAVSSWNAVYRSALRRTQRRDDVDRRRSQGRFVRNLLIPAVGAPLIFLVSPWSVLFATAAVPSILFLYAYAEYVNFAEAYDISEGTSK